MALSVLLDFRVHLCAGLNVCLDDGSERRRPWNRGCWLVVRADGDGTVCFPVDRFACDIPLVITDYQAAY
jgi:hypothetical protein